LAITKNFFPVNGEASMKRSAYLIFAKLFISITVLLLCSVGCTKVQPWQKGNLARSHMAFDPNPPQTQFEQHVYQSKEGTSGGYGVGGGGCGCN
jgi:hypothetical protein